MSEKFEIVIQGYIDQEWAKFFEGFKINHQPDGTTLLRGEVADQPALHGLLSRISQFGWILLRVEKTKE